MERGTYGHYGKNAIFIGLCSLIGLHATFFLFLALSNLIGVGLVTAGVSAAMDGWIEPFLLALLLGGGALFSALRALRAMTREKPVPQKTIAAFHDKKVLLTEKVKG